MLANQVLDLSGFLNWPQRLIRDYLGIVLDESPIEIRSLRLEDFEAARKVEAEAWGEQLRQFDREQFSARVGKFPEGNICAVKDERMVGLINMQQLNYDFDHPLATWDAATNGGFLRHDPQGAYLYGVNLSIARHALLTGAGNLLMLKIGALMLDLNVRGILLGVRPLRYHLFARRLTFEEYLWDDEGKVRDPELSLYCRMGFHIKLSLPNYFDDPESVNYGVLLMMDNPHHKPGGSNSTRR